MKWKKGVVSMAAAAALFGLSALPALSAVLLEEHFDAFDTAAGPGILVDTAHGRGWKTGVEGDDYEKGTYLKYPAGDNLRAEGGTIEMQLVRSVGERWEGLFALLDDGGKRLVHATADWESPVGDKGPGLDLGKVKGIPPLWYTAKGKGKKLVRGSTVSLERSVGQGQELHIVFTWGTKASQCAIYVNGERLPVAVDIPFGMVEAIRQAAWLTFGAEPVSAMEGATAHMDSVLEYVRVYDEPISGSTLYTADRFVPVTYQPLEIASLGHDAAQVAGFSGKLVTGDTMAVSLEGTPGQEAVFDLARVTDIRGEIPVSWKGYGVYLEEITFFEEDQIDLSEVEGYRVYVSPEPIGEVTEETVFVEELEVEEQSYLVEGLEPETPYYVAVMALMEDGTFLPVLEPKQSLAMTEVEGSPGIYEGTFTVDYKEVYPEAVVVGRLGSGGTVVALTGDEIFEIDARLTIEVATSPSELEADETSTSEITVTVTDANEDPVPDHEIRFVLATTSTYTGVVGGGSFTSEVGGSLERDFRGETNLFGQVTATYTAGFAAKTAIIVARDMTSDDTGAGYVTTYIDAAAELELEAVQEVAGKALGYSMVVTSSDEWLTADGESQARITALVTRDGIPVEGHRVGFTVSAGSGKVRTVRGETGDDGRALAVYTAGKKIGTALIRAVNHTVGITASVQIELRSDAPAKIAVTVTPDTLPANGRSRADVLVLVTDINDNPNEGVEVEYAVTIGSGKLRDIDEVTDEDGESTAQYVAGRLPGKVTIEVTVRSTVPTGEELLAARDLAVAVPDDDFF